MAKFCGRCGAKLDEATGLCPNCNADKMNMIAGQGGVSQMEGDDTIVPKSAQSKRVLRKQIKADKKAAKKAAKKAERANWSLGKKIRRFVLKLILMLFLIALLACGCLSALVYFGFIDIPVIKYLFTIAGIETIHPANGEFDEDNIGELYFYQTEDEHIVTNTNGVAYVDNEILLVASDTASHKDIQELAKQYDAEIVGWIEQTGDYQLKLPKVYSEEELDEIVVSLNKDERVYSASRNYAFVLEADKVEGRDGVIYGKKWEKDLQNFNDCEGKSWGLEAVEAPAAWDILDSHSSQVRPVFVGLIDGGFDDNHEDLGFLRTFYNAAVKNHGTHVAGTMAATSNNQEGICGVYPYGDGNLYGVATSGIYKYSENGWHIETSMFLKIAYSELILRNVKVINSSLGFNYKDWPLKNTGTEWNDQVHYLESNAYILGDFLNRLLEKGYDYVLINSAGNDSDRKNNIIYDSKYNSWTTVISRDNYPEVYDRIIVVGSVDSNFNISNFSDGGDRVDIYAPGETIFSTLPGNKYGNKGWSGTSMAAPHVSGVAAMVWSLNNDFTGSQVKEIVCRYGNMRCTSCKMVDAYMALEAAVSTSTDKTEKWVKNGGILCWVVDADNEAVKIENAVVTATNTSSGKTDSTTTDAAGHFEFVLPEGEYTLTVQADGYYDYILPEPVIVKNYGVNYLDDWIKMKKADSKSLGVPSTSSERAIVLTLDVSGSMAGTPLEETKKASAKFIDTVMEEDASIGIVTYDEVSEVASGFSYNKTALHNIISGLYDGGGTNIEAGLRDAQRMLEETNAKKKIIVLMSDGEPNEGLQGEELIEYAKEIKKTGTIIYTIGFFENLDDRSYAQYLMESIASDGYHYEVATADELVFFFEDMADQINGQKYIYVRIACPVDVSVTYDGETLNSSDESLNARTSFGTLTFEENREEMSEGTDDRVKVLRLKEGADYNLELTGTGHGIMNYTIGYMDDNGDYSDLRKFENIKITRRTKIDTVASNSSESILNIDKDGDGKYDSRLRAEANGYGEEIITSSWIFYVMIGAAVFVLLDIVAIAFYVRGRKKGE